MKKGGRRGGKRPTVVISGPGEVAYQSMVVAPAVVAQWLVI